LASTVHICIGPSVDINVNNRCDFYFSLLVSWPSYFAEIDHIRPEPTHSTHQVVKLCFSQLRMFKLLCKASI